MGKTRKLSRGSRKHGRILVGKRMEKRMEKKNVKYGKKRTYRRRKLMGKKWGGVTGFNNESINISIKSSSIDTLIINGAIFKKYVPTGNCEAEENCYEGYHLNGNVNIWITIQFQDEKSRFLLPSDFTEYIQPYLNFLAGKNPTIESMKFNSSKLFLTDVHGNIIQLPFSEFKQGNSGHIGTNTVPSNTPTNYIFRPVHLSNQPSDSSSETNAMRSMAVK